MKIDLNQLTHREKITLCEALWMDISRDPDSVESPAWHADELAKTQQRIDAGLEKTVPWEVAKKKLLKKFKRTRNSKGRQAGRAPKALRKSR